MKNSPRGFLRWGALALELFSLFVLYNAAFMVPFPYSERIGMIAAAAGVSLFFAGVSSFHWDWESRQPRPPTWKIVLAPPVILWAVAVIPPALGLGSVILGYEQTGMWPNRTRTDLRTHSAHRAIA